MFFVLHALDRLDAGEERLTRYDAHKAHAASAATRGIRVALGGPLVSEDGSRMIGSLAVYEAPDRATIEKFVQADPFRQFGIWADVRLNPFDPRLLPNSLTTL